MNKLSQMALQNCFLSTINKKNYNQQLFSLIAPKYNFATRLLSLGMDQFWKKKLIKILPELKKPICLDIACGTGDITFKIAKKYPKGKIFGLDVTKEMIQQAYRFNNFSNIEFICLDMCDTKFENNHFDLITGSYALRNAPNLNDALVEINRILKVNGTFAILDFAKFDNKFLQKIQYRILKIWGSFWGLILHGNFTIYSYIAESLKNYPSNDEFKKLLNELNFIIIKEKIFFLGCIKIYILKKI